MNFPNHNSYNLLDCPRRTAQDSIAVEELFNVVESSVGSQAPHTAAFFKQHPTAVSYHHAPSTVFTQSYPGHSWDETRLHADLLAPQIQSLEHVPQSPVPINYYATLGQHLIPPEVGWTLQVDSPATWRGYLPRTHVQTQPTTFPLSHLSHLAGGNAFTPFNSFAFAPMTSSPQTEVDIHAIDGYTSSVRANVPIAQTRSSGILRDAVPSKTSPNYIAWHQEDSLPLFMNQYTPPRTPVSPPPPPMSFPVPRTDPTADPGAGLPPIASSPHIPAPLTPPSTYGTHSPSSTGSPPAQSDATAAAEDAARRTCPICHFMQKRKVDMKRHIRTHAKEKPWTCCGLPLGEDGDCDGAGRMTRTRRGDGKVRALGGVKFLGGCGKRFSRRDALQKHLRRFPRCVGDPHAVWHSGNAAA